MPRITRGRGHAGEAESAEVCEAQSKRAGDTRQWRQQRIGQALPHFALPACKPAPRIGIRAERGSGSINISGNADTGAVGGGMGTFEGAAAPLQADVLKFELAECGADVCEGKKGGADVVQVTGERRFQRIYRAARSSLGFEHANAPARLRVRVLEAQAR